MPKTISTKLKQAEQEDIYHKYNNLQLIPLLYKEVL